MKELIKLDDYPVNGLLKYLLQDKTTKKNIIFASESYTGYGVGYTNSSQMTEDLLLGFSQCEIQPRVYKVAAEQNERTRKKAEVFTPAWVVNMMNNHCDEEWFARKDVFNSQSGHVWETVTEKITFPTGRHWTEYVDSRRLEITCGEAPYIVSRYDSSTGEVIPIEKRIGILDRKLRVINENAENEKEWLIWAYRALQSVYGYEFQGDNLLIARINILNTFCDYVETQWHRLATKDELQKAINIICRNFWQMDGLSDTVPFGIPQEEFFQLSMFDEINDIEPEENLDCVIYNWRSKKSILFKKLKERGNTMKFDFVIGNPPYQEDQVSDDMEGSLKNYSPPIYHRFMDGTYSVSNKVLLIHPARFLFNAGSTPKKWNMERLNDEHFKVLYFEMDSRVYFPNVDIKGGICITYRDSEKNFGSIGAFTPFEELNSVKEKVCKKDFESFKKIVFSRTAYRFTDELHKEHPEAVGMLSNGHKYDMASNILERLPHIFLTNQPNDGCKYVQIYGRVGNDRVYRYIKSSYINSPPDFKKWKVFVPQANGSGAIGEVLSTPVIGQPVIGHTETFMSIGAFNTESEARACYKYICSKFCRAMLGILKVTPVNAPDTWKYVPLQDFTENSDIDWTVPVAEIDKQLYKKYGLTQEEINFIETHVKEMK